MSGYGAPPPYGPPTTPPYGSSSPYGAPSPYPYQSGSPFAARVPSGFLPETDPTVVACFRGKGSIEDRELQVALSSYNQVFNIRTVRLLMFVFTGTNCYRIGPEEFISLFRSLHNWRDIFEGFDRDKSGKIDSMALQDALVILGFAVSPVVLDMLVSKFNKTGGMSRAIEYDNFIECCLIVKGLKQKFRLMDTTFTDTVTFTYESFMLTVLPFLIT